MDKQKTVITARKVESLAIGFIGICLFSLGTSYFQERFIYRVPRILTPVFNLFGNVGLAIGMLILGGGLIYYGFTKWKSVAEKKNLYWILAVIGLAAGIALANINFKPNKSADSMENIDKRREAEMDKFRNSGELKFHNAQVDEHIANYNALYKRYEQSLKSKDEAAVTACELELREWVTKTGDIVQKLSNMDDKVELGRYQAKLIVQWEDLRLKYSE
ncbi:MAG: hypothetical protein FWF72_01560 [Paludibacter sp.]|nr:hypothetical protein [Paludibacter sp.]